ncbi:S-methyl-5-thioribose-1-phosphate isomerase [Ktedonobacter robiniae]|uniref:Methylthioribose-1-phosphate isomerase n=1 Tax=Ktedonobacter robiniae TaxID=2778365 RepID=A0ABQ3UUI2_9CHLR|nr:S-methyl-5-thioribose-1-phosphate isomerase [Ktedonobacter robiniae]GHO56332.1 methylthioribose-1-phosphate isomerase [Ktedonobacter robiniae]
MLDQRLLQPVWWEENEQGVYVGLIDQTLLPQQTKHLRLTSEVEVAEAIRALRVRGAPAIGAAAAFGLVLGLARQVRERGETLGLVEAREQLQAIGALLTTTRPTAVNLAWAIKRLLRCVDENFALVRNAQELQRVLLAEARAIVQEDHDACERMGELGAALLAEGDTVLTHCNAGALATMGIGTALAPIYVAHNAGKRVHVLVDETRPLLQGSRLTAWELQRAGVPLTLITDNMAGSFMRQGRVQAVFVGADCIAANGDVANKIGTYSVAVLASVHQIPFYVVAPTSTFDLSLSSGEQIPVEQRKPEEVTSVRGSIIAPEGVNVTNPAFDVTPHQYITALITEKGIFRAPYEALLRNVW